MCMIPARDSATSVFVADDVDRAWEQIGPFMLHDAQMYASWLGDTAAASKSTASTIDALRAEGGAYRILTPDEAVDHVRAHGVLALHPLCGGCPPELAWETLELVAGEGDARAQLKIRSSVRCTERSTSPIVMRPSAHDRRRVTSTLLTVSTIAAAVSGSIDDKRVVQRADVACARTGRTAPARSDRASSRSRSRRASSAGSARTPAPPVA